MLKRKLISLVCSLATMVSFVSFATGVQAAEAAPAAELSYTVVPYVFDQDSYDLGYQEYKMTISVKLANVGLTDNGKAAALKRYSGSRVSSYAGKINYDTTKLYSDKSLMTTKVVGGAPTCDVIASGLTFNWYTTDYTEMLEGTEVILHEVNFYAMDANGNSTADASTDPYSFFSWNTTDRAVTYRVWDTVAGSDMATSFTQCVLGDNPIEDGWIGNLGLPSQEPVFTGVTFDTADATKNATTATVVGEATYTLPAVYAVYDSETVDSTAVDAEWTITGGGSIADGIYTAPVAPAYGENPLTVTLTATYEGQKATVTVTVPAKEADPVFSASATVLPSYYTADNAEFSRKQVTMLNRTATNLTLEFKAGDRDPKTFNVELPAIEGGAADVFEAWVMNAPDAWSIFVDGVEAKVAE